MASLPRLAPMKATSGELPAGDGWVFEIKYDGMRLVAEVDGEADTLVLRTTNDIDATARFPEVAGLAAAVGPHQVVLDGEVVALDEHGRPSFGLLMSRRAAAAGDAPAPISFVLFDLLHLDGSDTTGLPYSDRRKLLEQVVEAGPTWEVAPVHEGDGAALLEVAEQQGLEGLVAKRVDSRYEPGKRTRQWIKVKVRRRQELVVGGWLAGKDGRSGRLGSILVGYHEPDGSLHYAGRVGTGFNAAELARMEALLRELAQDESPFDPPPPREVLRLEPHFCRPEPVVEVEFAEWTGDDRLRHPSYLGQRIDKPAEQVMREPG
jgi:bifunctional non-homologous end joining protein LigD